MPIDQTLPTATSNSLLLETYVQYTLYGVSYHNTKQYNALPLEK